MLGAESSAAPTGRGDRQRRGVFTLLGAGSLLRCLSLLRPPLPALFPQLCSLRDAQRILVHRGEVTQLTASLALTLGTFACRPLPVTGRTRKQPATHKWWESS